MRRSGGSSCGAMRMAMSCLAFPDEGRPTLRARRSSTSVDSGMPERSSLLSGIGLAFFAGRLAGADDANDFLGMAIAGARDDGAWGFRAESGGFLEFDFGGVAEGGKEDGDVKVAAAGRVEKEGSNELR